MTGVSITNPNQHTTAYGFNSSSLKAYTAWQILTAPNFNLNIGNFDIRFEPSFNF